MSAKLWGQATAEPPTRADEEMMLLAAAAAEEAEADEVKAYKAAVEVSHQSAWRRPVFGSMWVRHAGHGLVHRLARIAARNNQP